MSQRDDEISKSVGLCKGKTREKRFPYPSSPCWHKVWKDGYCKVHHPSEKRRRQSERDAKKDQYRLTATK